MFQILLWYPWKGKKEYVPLRTAYSQDSRYGMQPKARQSSRAGAAKTRTETCELVEEKQKLLDIREKRTREPATHLNRKSLHQLDFRDLKKIQVSFSDTGVGPRGGTGLLRTSARNKATAKGHGCLYFAGDKFIYGCKKIKKYAVQNKGKNQVDSGSPAFICPSTMEVWSILFGKRA
ncbi:hypothetical protein TNCV_1602251 [Trichonephila clavipes]|nr:hypothetical protein TNCV_1602251 [Trichonephila clavipes]